MVEAEEARIAERKAKNAAMKAQKDQ